MAIVPWTKKRGLTEAYNARNEIDQLIDGLFRDNWMFPFRGDAEKRLGQASIMPRSDISETKQSFEISMELPGLRESDVDISIDGNVLTVKGEKKHEEKQEKKDYFYSERSYGAFERSVRLPDSAKVDAISATFNNGVLEIKIPKKAIASSGPKKIQLSKAKHTIDNKEKSKDKEKKNNKKK